jgi:tetratricopeptide (TPR) repeat protein
MKIVIGCIVGLWVCGLLVRTVLPEHTRRAETAGVFEVFQQKASASLVGEFRSSLSGYLWLKTDEYLHGGVLLRPMMEHEQHAGAHEASSADELGEHHGETGVIPEPERDWRGIWGDLERNVKPYFDIRRHRHRHVREALPLFRFMTWADPTFVPGYVVGAQIILFSNKTQIDEALRFLREGLRYNPDSIALNTEYARHLITKRMDYEGAETYLLKAVRLSEKNKADGFEKESLRDAYRWLVLSYNKRGMREKERYWALEGLKHFPDDGICLRAVSGK